MWSTEYTSYTPADASSVWKALHGMLSGVPLGSSGDSYEMHGPFAVGTAITVTPRGQESMTSIITELEEPQVYADQTVFGDLVLTFRHVLRSDGAQTVVTHQLEIDGPGSDEIGPQLGPQISEDFPATMAALLAAAESSHESQ